MRLHIVRHADPDYELDYLTPRGELEADALAARLQHVGLRRLFASPMGRAQRTAQPTARATGLPIETLAWTAELSGPRVEVIGGTAEPVWNVDGEYVRESYDPAIGFSWQAIPVLADPAIETLCVGVADASDAFLADLGYERDGGSYRVADGAEPGDVAVVCHAGFGATWLAHLLCVPPPLLWCGLFLAPTSVTTILFEQRSAGLAVPRALRIGDTSHIVVAGLEANLQGLLVD